MATTEPQSETSDNVADGIEPTEQTLTLVGHGTATRTRGRQTDDVAFTIEDDVEVSIEITFTIEELSQNVLTNSSVSGTTFRNGWNHAPRNHLREYINEELAESRVKVYYNQFDEWDVGFDGDVRAWLELLEQTKNPLDQAQNIRSHDEFGDGLDAAIMELERRDGLD